MLTNIIVFDILYVFVVLCSFNVRDCDTKCIKWSAVPLETRVYEATIVLRAVVLDTDYQSKSLELSLVSIYRGGNELAIISPYRGSPYNTTDRQVRIKILPRFQSCFNWSTSDKETSELVVFARISDPYHSLDTTPSDGPWFEATAAPVPWTLGVDIAIWSSVGWGGWNEWGPCSSSCGGGYQIRSRVCAMLPCEGYGVQKRTCNTFSCSGAMNPLTTSARKNFHPSKARWEPVSDRPGAYSLKPNTYIWIPSTDFFSNSNGNSFSKDFTLFVTLRLTTQSGGYGEGTLFSVRSRRRNGSFLSLELCGRGQARLLHYTPNSGTTDIRLPVALHDFRWHKIAISIEDGTLVHSYVDCRWVRTDILTKHDLDTPSDADIIIGYLFSGDLEELTIVPQSNLAANQCSTIETPVYNDQDEYNQQVRYNDNSIDAT